MNVFRLYLQTKRTTTTDQLGRGKESVAINLKDKAGVHILRRLCSDADVLIEPFRAGEGPILQLYSFDIIF